MRSMGLRARLISLTPLLALALLLIGTAGIVAICRLARSASPLKP